MHFSSLPQCSCFLGVFLGFFSDWTFQDCLDFSDLASCSAMRREYTWLLFGISVTTTLSCTTTTEDRSFLTSKKGDQAVCPSVSPYVRLFLLRSGANMQRVFWPDTSYQKMPYVAKCCHNLPKNCQMSPQYAINGQTIFPHAQKKSQDICRWDKIYPLEQPSVMVCFLLFLVIWFWLNYRSNQGRAELGVPCIFPFKYKVKHILRSKE